jgi:hypothetical protein
VQGTDKRWYSPSGQRGGAGQGEEVRGATGQSRANVDELERRELTNNGTHRAGEEVQQARAKRCDRLGLRCVGEPGKCEEKRGEEWGEEGKENASKTSSGGKKKQILSRSLEFG